MFRSIFDHPQGDIFFFTSVTKDKLIRFVVACLLYLLCFVLMLLRALPREVKKKYLPEDGQKLTETCWRILRLLKQYDHFNVSF
jgi:hypothetical protein